MVFPDDEVMVTLMALAIGDVRDSESTTNLHLEDDERSCDVVIKPQIVAALEQRAWIEIDEATTKISITESGTRAVDRWMQKRLKIKAK